MNITQIYTHPSRYLSRGAHLPTAIILHEVNEPLASVSSRMGTNLINALKPLAHQSYHYAVEGAAVHAYVTPAQAARALADAETLTGWTPQLPGIDPDLYTLNIAVIVGAAPMGDNLCIPCCGREYPVITMFNLRRLIHQLAETYDIDVSGNLLWLHGDELCDICLDDLRIPPEIVTPGEEDWLCDRLGELPISTEPPAALVGADCSVYVPAAIVTAGLCDALGDLPTGTVTAPAMCNELVVTPDCEVIPLDDGDWEIYKSGGICQTGRQTPGNTASGAYAVAEGFATTASGSYSHAEGQATTASGQRSHAEGLSTVASGLNSHAEGDLAQATGQVSHAEGYDTLASGYAAHAEGRGTVASDDDCHAEGRDTLADGHGSHAEGKDTVASGVASHATGEGSVASGDWANASGYQTLASGVASRAEGWMTIASGDNSYAHGEGTEATVRNAEASGRHALATHRAEKASSDGMFEVAGDAQRRLINMKNEVDHTLTGWYELATWGEAPGVLVPPHGAFNLRAQIIGMTEDAAQRWAYNLTACISRAAGAPVVDAVAVTALFESDANYDATVIITGNRASVAVGRTGGTAYTIRWVALVEIAQVIWAGA